MKGPAPRSPFGALLLDLDGTLLDVTMTEFLDAYFLLLAPRFGAGGDVAGFREILLSSVRSMMHNRGGRRTLDEVFLEACAPRVAMTKESLRETFRDFYRNEFESLRGRTRPVPGARAFLGRALELGYDLALATNPVFFREAIEARVRWAGLEDVPFRFVSSAENMHACKPHPEYFLEVLDNMGRAPGECVMAGDDPLKDMPAGEVGITTFFVPRPGENRLPPGTDRHGSLGQLGLWLEELGPAAGR